MADPPFGKLSWKTKLAYGSGDTGFSLTGTLIGAFVFCSIGQAVIKSNA